MNRDGAGLERSGPDVMVWLWSQITWTVRARLVGEARSAVTGPSSELAVSPTRRSVDMHGGMGDGDGRWGGQTEEKGNETRGCR